jgi:hypothetical protein
MYRQLATERVHYNMIRSKENTETTLRKEFISYLYGEYRRKTTKITPNTYSEILRFVKTPEGCTAFEQFKSLDRSQLGLSTPTPSPFKRVTL